MMVATTKTPKRLAMKSTPGFRPLFSAMAANGFTYALGRCDSGTHVKIRVFGAAERDGYRSAPADNRAVTATVLRLAAKLVEAGIHPSIGPDGWAASEAYGRNMSQIAFEFSAGDDEPAIEAAIIAVLKGEV